MSKVLYQWKNQKILGKRRYQAAMEYFHSASFQEIFLQKLEEAIPHVKCADGMPYAAVYYRFANYVNFYYPELFRVEDFQFVVKSGIGKRPYAYAGYLICFGNWREKEGERLLVNLRVNDGSIATKYHTKAEKEGYDPGSWVYEEEWRWKG